MRKVSLEINLGKKSQARFPRRFPSNLKLKITAPAIQAEALPPLGPALTLFGVNARNFCEEFNYYSKDYDAGFPVSLHIYVTQTKSYYYDMISPNCYNLFHRCFDFYEGYDLFIKNKTILLLGLNISLIKNTQEGQSFTHTLVKGVKQVMGSLRSYGFFSKKKKLIDIKKKYFRINSNIYNTKFTRKKK